MNDLDLEGLSDKQLRLFAVRCARRVQHLMPDPRSIAALDVAERYANGEATDEELKVAWDAAWDVENSVVQAANFAARVATRVARAVAWDAAGAGARRTASDAASAAGSVAAGELDENSSCVTLQRWYAARDAERAEQQKILDEIRQEQL